MRQYDEEGGPSNAVEILIMAGVSIAATCIAAVLLLGALSLAYKHAVRIPSGVQIVERLPLHEFDLGE